MLAGSDGLKLVPSQPTVLAVVVAVDILIRVSANATAVTAD